MMKAVAPAGRVYWITGLSGSGKSTLAEELHASLVAMGRNAVMVDGDVVRELVLSDVGMDRESRLRIAGFNARLCRFLALQGLTVVCATISLFHSVQRWNRDHLPCYTEILLDTPLEAIEQRDPRGLYKRARAGDLSNVVGIDIVPEWPDKPDFTFNADGRLSPAAMAEIIYYKSEVREEFEIS